MRSKRLTLFLAGGLGNQLFQYAAALSESSGKIVLDITLGNPRVSQNGLPCLLDFDLPNRNTVIAYRQEKEFFFKTAWFLLRFGIAPKKAENSFFARWIIKGLGTLVLSLWVRRPTKLILATNNGYFRIPDRFKHAYFLGYFQSFFWASIPNVQKKLKAMRLINPSEEYMEFERVKSNSRALAIHVRLGDYRLDSGYGILDKNYYSQALEYIQSINPITDIWLFSNEVDEALKLIPGCYHAIITVVPEFNGSASETLAAMRLAGDYIIGNSSLSWWGAFLCVHEKPIIVAPKPWFRGYSEPCMIVPEGWHRIPGWSSLQ